VKNTITMETRLTNTDFSVAIETLFASAAIRLGRVVADSVGVTLAATRPTSVNCKQQHFASSTVCLPSDVSKFYSFISEITAIN